MEGNAPFVSKLSEGTARFLAEVLDHALVNGRRTADDFIRHFPPGVIMSALDGVPKLRAGFLVTLVGVKERTALRTSTSDAGRLLDSALEEGDTDAQSVVAIFDPDDRIQYLDARKVWTFLLEGEFWRVARSKDGGAYKVSQAHVAFMLDRAIVHHLLTYEQIIDGITIEVIAEKLPRNDMARLLKVALAAGRSNKPFNDTDLYNGMTSATLVDYVPLPHVMQTVVAPMAATSGFVESSGAKPVVPPIPSSPKAAAAGATEGAEPAEAWPDSTAS
jgi:hypothetical protein